MEGKAIKSETGAFIAEARMSLLLLSSWKNTIWRSQASSQNMILTNSEYTLNLNFPASELCEIDFCL